jgi:type I restriction-modification system DNA methylase subunit
LLLSCILIALENPWFIKSYKSYTNAKQLAEFLITTTINEFQNWKIQEGKLEILKVRFEFIKTNTSLSKKAWVLLEIINDVNDNIKDFIKTHEYFDVLWQLYIEFLRYANSDKWLWIVLTPPHITEFMARIVGVNKDSVVYDNCTWTGWFLVSAMKLMIEDAKWDQEKIKQIKKEQLVWVEYQDYIFALACSNMFIHQDWKTSILHGSCFDEEIIKKVKSRKPTIWLLNPPYKSDKKNDTDEYEFILNNLSCLEQWWICVAIVPMQEALAQDWKVYEYKKRILQEHTLEAVFSMPNELFFNSKVNVVSCIMIFTAKKPHPQNKKVYFWYYKEDGFVKRKNKWRVDLNNTFEEEIKEKWITSYMNKENVPWLSVTKVITPEDEWCVEAYMETDYSKLNKEDFVKSVKDFIYFRNIYLWS